VQGQFVSDAERAYAAGFFDGEGSVTINSFRDDSRSWKLSVVVGQLDPRPLRFLLKRWGGQISGPRVNGQYEWRIHSASAARFLSDVHPYLIVKAEQAAIVAEFRRRMGASRGRNGIGQAERDRRDDLRQQLLVLNRRGKRWEDESALAPIELLRS
jgi:hypothetical protein